MARHRFIPVVVLAFAVVLAMSDSRSARACQCAGIEPDVAYQNAILVFSGTVDKITELSGEIPHDGKSGLRSDGRLVRITVEEYFKGTGGPEIELRGQNSSCDSNFEAGKRYIVYATQNPQTGALAAIVCSRTRLLDDWATPDINYLRRAARGERPTMLYGFAFKNTAESARRGRPEPLANLAVIVETDEKRIELKTDSRGYFETFDLSPGSYSVRTAVTGKLRRADAQSVQLGSGVASVIFHTTTMGSFKGKVVDREDRPVSEIQVELLEPGDGERSSKVITYVSTQEDGTFVFDELFAGRYMIAVNSTARRSLYSAPFLPSYFPRGASSADAQVITIAEGVTVEAGNFVLQDRHPTVAVSGIVVTADGRPVPSAYVSLNQSGGERDLARSVQTDSEGHFVHRAFEGVTYTLHSIANAQTGGTIDSDRVEITAAKNTKPVRLVLKTPQ